MAQLCHVLLVFAGKMLSPWANAVALLLLELKSVMARSDYSSKFWWCAFAAQLLACGGTVSDPGAGAAAGSGAGGGASAGASGTSCTYEGKTYADGERFPASDGCNSCACQKGSVSCTLLACATGCQSGGQWYQPGDTFKVDCNSCVCQAGGQVSCTDIGCVDQCSALQGQYAATLERAKVCNPAQADECTKSISGSVSSCGCPTPVNASNGDALRELSDLTKQAADQQCISPCPPCLPPGPATCTPEGMCEEAPIRPQ